MRNKIYFLFFVALLVIAIISLNIFDIEIYENPNDKNINIRMKPNLQGKIIGKLSSGEYFLVTDSENQWSSILTGEISGYVFSPLIQKTYFKFSGYKFDVKDVLNLTFIIILFFNFFGLRKNRFIQIRSKIIEKDKNEYRFKSSIKTPDSKSIHKQKEYEPSSKQKKYKSKWQQKNLTNEQKGEAFEKFVAKKINRSRRNFKILQWRGDKYVEGIYAMANKYPDFELECSLGEKKKKFMIECKWRKRFFKDGINIEKLNEYMGYQKETGQRVFLVVGISGSPDNPKYLFVLPVDEIKESLISRDLLFTKYSKQPETDFFYDFHSDQLS